MLNLLLCVLFFGSICAASIDTSSSSDDVSSNTVKAEEIQVAKRSGKHRIVGGNIADRGEYPWLIVLKYRRRVRCGGTIIDASTIVTAAHCLTRSNKRAFQVTAGDYKVWKREASEQTIKVKKIIMHPQYKVKSKHDGDIAILKLSKRLKFNKFVKPLPLAQDEDMETRLRERSNCVSAGIGDEDNYSSTPTKTKEVRAVIQSSSSCLNLARRFNVEHTENMICSKDINNGVCSGDSGGPLICYDDTAPIKSKAYLVGVVSFGSANCFTGYNVYTRVLKYVDWINNKL